MFEHSGFRALHVSVCADSGVGEVALNRPSTSNSVTMGMIDELPRAVSLLDSYDAVKVILLTGKGVNCCSGLDFRTMQEVTGSLATDGEDCPAKARQKLLAVIKRMQAACSAFEACSKPTVAAVHGACFGAGVDLITACDIRCAAADAKFCVKEVDLGITADLGTLQRLPKIVGEGRARDLALTARVITGQAAYDMGLVTRVCERRDALPELVTNVAAELASKPALAVKGTKQVMVHGAGRTVGEGLEYVSLWNSSFLWSKELQDVVAKVTQKHTRSKM